MNKLLNKKMSSISRDHGVVVYLVMDKRQALILSTALSLNKFKKDFDNLATL